MKLKKLIPTSEFVLKISKSKEYNVVGKVAIITNYAKIMSSKPTIDMFIKAKHKNVWFKGTVSKSLFDNNDLIQYNSAGFFIDSHPTIESIVFESLKMADMNNQRKEPLDESKFISLLPSKYLLKKIGL